MPTCAFQAGFGVIDEYLNLKEQMEFTAETYDLLDLDQKVPHSDFLAFPDQKCTIKVELNTSEAGMDSYPEYSPQYSLFSTEPYSSCSPLTSSSPHLLPSHVSQPMLGTNSLTTLMSLNSSNSNSSASDSGTTTFVAKDAGSGCTVIQRDQPQTRGDSTELFDLQRPMCDNDFKLVIKAEPQDESQLPQTCQLGGGGVLIRGHGTEDTAMERVLDQLIRNDVQVKEDCKILGISPDPTQWCLDDVQRWVRWICRKHSYKDDCWHLFNVNGLTLCQMGEADFKWRAPEAASCLFHQLEACKLACRFAPEMPISSYPSPPYGGSDVPYLPSSHLHGQPDPSVSPSPSVSSTCSTASCSSSSNGYHHVDNNDDDVFSLATGNDTRRQSAAAQLPYPPAPGSRAHPHPPSQRQPKQTIHLWQFLKELLEDPDNYHGCIKWTDRSRGIFKIEDSSKVARLWGRRKNRPAMNYDKLSRSVRQYYKKGIIKKTEHSKRLVYQFCPPYL